MNTVKITLVFGVLAFLAGGCRETHADRERISLQTEKLAKEIQENPNSEIAKASLKELIEILNGNWSFARSRACYALGHLGPLAAPAVPDLLRAAQCGDPFVVACC